MIWRHARINYLLRQRRLPYCPVVFLQSSSHWRHSSTFIIAKSWWSGNVVYIQQELFYCCLFILYRLCLEWRWIPACLRFRLCLFLAFSLFSFHFFTFAVVSTSCSPPQPCLLLSFTNLIPIPISQLLRSLFVYTSICCLGPGHRHSTRDKNQDKEIQRMITAGWITFAKHRDIFKGNIVTCLKRRVCHSRVVPAMTYGAETWALATQAKNKLVAAKQRWKGVY